MKTSAKELVSKIITTSLILSFLLAGCVGAKARKSESLPQVTPTHVVKSIKVCALSSLVNPQIVAEAACIAQYSSNDATCEIFPGKVEYFDNDAVLPRLLSEQVLSHAIQNGNEGGRSFKVKDNFGGILRVESLAGVGTMASIENSDLTGGFAAESIFQDLAGNITGINVEAQTGEKYTLDNQANILGPQLLKATQIMEMQCGQ